MRDISYPGLEGRTAVVTGGAKGFGEACVRTLVDQGARVAIFDTDAEAGEQLASSLDGKARAYRLDVSVSSEVESAFQHVASDLAPPTLLVNNAGIMSYGAVTEVSEQEWDRLFGVNLKSQFCNRSAV